MSAGFIVDLHLVQVCDSDGNPDGQLILIPVWRLYCFFKHCQHRRKWQEPLLQTAGPELVRRVALLSFVRKSTQNPVEQVGRDVHNRSDSDDGAGFGVTAEQPKVDGPIEEALRITRGLRSTCGRRTNRMSL